MNIRTLSRWISFRHTANTIPIYFGTNKIIKYVNSKRFINANDYSSINNVIEKIKEIDKSDDIYLEMLCEKPFVEEGYINNQLKALTNFLYNIFDKEKVKPLKDRSTLIFSKNEKPT